MPTSDPASRFRSAFVLLFALAVTAVFLLTIQGFLMSLLVAVVLTGLCRPIYRGSLKAIGPRPTAAALFMTVWDIYLETFDAYLPEVSAAAEA